MQHPVWLHSWHACEAWSAFWVSCYITPVCSQSSSLVLGGVWLGSPLSLLLLFLSSLDDVIQSLNLKYHLHADTPKFVLPALTCPLSSSHTYDTDCLGFLLWGIRYLTSNLTFLHKLLSPLAVFLHYSFHYVNRGVCFDDSSLIPLKLKQTPTLSALPLQHTSNSTTSLYLHGNKLKMLLLIFCNGLRT